MSKLDPELLSLFSDKPMDKEWEQMMERANKTIGEETSLDFSWGIEEEQSEEQSDLETSKETCSSLDPNLLELLK